MSDAPQGKPLTVEIVLSGLRKLVAISPPHARYARVVNGELHYSRDGERWWRADEFSERMAAKGKPL